MALIDVTTCLRRVPQAAGNEDIISDVIEEAEDRASQVCKRTLAEADYVEYHDIGRQQTTLALRNFPVTGTTVVQTGANSASPRTLVSGMDYALDAATGIVTLLAGHFAEGPRNVKVSYTAGYTEATCPAGLRAALFQLVGWLLESAGNSGVRSEGQDGYSVQYEELVDGVPQSIAAALNPWRRVAVG